MRGRFAVIAMGAAALLLTSCPSRPRQGGEGVLVAGPGQPAQVTRSTTGPTAAELEGVAVPGKVEGDEEGFAQLSFFQAARYSADVGKPLFLYFYTPWCGPCKELSAKTFTTEAFRTYARSIVSIKIDAHPEAGKAVADRFRVDSYPTMIVCRPGGEEIERFFGFHPAEEFVRTIQDYVAGRNTASDLARAATQNPDDLGLAFEAGRELAIRDRGAEAIPFLERVWKKDKANAQGNVARAMLLLGQTVYLDLLQQPDKALPILDELGQRFPTTWHATEAIYMIARIHLDKGERDKAADVLRNRVVISGTDPIAYHHFGLFCLRYNFLLDEAAARLEAGVVKHPDAAYLWKMLAEVCHRSDKLERAVSAIGEACRLEPANDSYRQLGDVFRRALLKSKERQ